MVLRPYIRTDSMPQFESVLLVTGKIRIIAGTLMEGLFRSRDEPVLDVSCVACYGLLDYAGGKCAPSQLNWVLCMNTLLRTLM